MAVKPFFNRLLENLIQQQTKSERVCVFSGPLFANNDRIFSGRDSRGATNVQIPRRYWKIIVANSNEEPTAYAFMLEQDLSDVDLEMAVPPPWRRFMVPVEQIEQSMGRMVELNWLKDHDQFGREESNTIAEMVRH